MLRLVPQAFFETNVQIPVPGQEKDEVIRVSFKYLDKDKLRAFLESLEGREDADALAEIVVGWKDVDEIYSHGNLGALLKAYPMAALSFFEAFQKEAFKAKSGN